MELWRRGWILPAPTFRHMVFISSPNRNSAKYPVWSVDFVSNMDYKVTCQTLGGYNKEGDYLQIVLLDSSNAISHILDNSWFKTPFPTTIRNLRFS